MIAPRADQNKVTQESVKKTDEVSEQAAEESVASKEAEQEAHAFCKK